MKNRAHLRHAEGQKRGVQRRKFLTDSAIAGGAALAAVTVASALSLASWVIERKRNTHRRIK